MDKTTIIVLVLLTLFVGTLVYSFVKPTLPVGIYFWRRIYKRITTPDYNQKIRDHLPNYGLTEKNLTIRQLHGFLHERVNYSNPDDIDEDGLPPFFRRSKDPIEILFMTRMGRCQEFTVAYTGLLSAYGHKVRMIIDNSKVTDSSSGKRAGDHMWVEVFINDKWTHIDPIEANFDTGYAINEPSMYALKWNKDINKIYAIDEEIEMVTENYKFKEHDAV